ESATSAYLVWRFPYLGHSTAVPDDPPHEPWASLHESPCRRENKAITLRVNEVGPQVIHIGISQKPEILEGEAEPSGVRISERRDTVTVFVRVPRLCCEVT